MQVLKCYAACSGAALALCLTACPFSHRLDQVSRVECDPRPEQLVNDDDELLIVFDANEAMQDER